MGTVSKTRRVTTPTPAPAPAPHTTPAATLATPAEEEPSEAALAITAWEAPYGRPHLVYGIAAQMILAILSHQEEINAYGKGSVELHFGPNGVQGHFHPLWAQTIHPAIRRQFAALEPYMWRSVRRTGRRAGAGAILSNYIGAQDLELHGTERAPWEADTSTTDTSPTPHQA